MENNKEILTVLIDIKNRANFDSNRNDARKVYKLLTEKELILEVEQNILVENIFKIERSLLTDEDKRAAYSSFIISLTKIIDTIDYNVNGENYEVQ